MNSIQRVLAAMTWGRSEHGTPDRVPCLPVPLMQGALVHQCTVEQFFAMPAQRIAEAQVRINEMFNGIPDGVAGFPNVIEDVTAFGIGLDYHYPNSTPAVSGMRLRTPADIDGLLAPDPTSSDQLRKTLDVIRILAAGIGKRKVVIGACIAPFSLPSMLMGTANWMRLLYTDRTRNRCFRRLMDVCTDFVVSWAQRQIDAGAHVVVLADGMASSTIIPRPVFEEYALPVIRETISRIRGMIAYEAVGRVDPFIDAFADVGAIAMLVGEEDDIRNCKRALRGRVGIIGNINNMKMRRWSPPRVEMQAKAILSQGMDGYGFALANQGPELPFDTSLDNVRALIEAVEKYGRYECEATAAAA